MRLADISEYPSEIMYPYNMLENIFSEFIEKMKSIKSVSNIELIRTLLKTLVIIFFSKEEKSDNFMSDTDSVMFIFTVLF